MKVSSVSSELLSHWSRLHDVYQLKWNFDFRLLIPQPGHFEWTKYPVTSKMVKFIDSISSQASEVVDNGTPLRILLRKKRSGFKSAACRHLTFEEESTKSDAKEIDSSSPCIVSKSPESIHGDSLHPAVANTERQSLQFLSSRRSSLWDVTAASKVTIFQFLMQILHRLPMLNVTATSLMTIFRFLLEQCLSRNCRLLPLWIGSPPLLNVTTTSLMACSGFFVSETGNWFLFRVTVTSRMAIFRLPFSDFTFYERS